MEERMLEKAVFAAGCFWGVEEEFGRLKGVSATRVGYTGGRTANPTYREVCGGNTGHAEAVEVTYDPEAISFESLLRAFFKMHNPGSALSRSHHGGQYRSAVFALTPAQKLIAEATVARLKKERAFGPAIYTEVSPAGEFWEAEGYHQKYHQRHGGGCH